MDGNFRKILALVDYTPASLLAVEEAEIIASKFGSELCLMHISHGDGSSDLMTPGVPFIEAREETEDDYYSKVDRLEKVKTEMSKRYDTPIFCLECRGDFIDVVRDHVKKHSIDLIVLGAKKRNWIKDFFAESKIRSIIKAVDCEVLCVHGESKPGALKKIVLPIGKSVPTKKIVIAYEIAKRFTARIHLIAVNKQERGLDEKSTAALISSYRYLRDITNMPIECNKIIGKSLTAAAMHYANVIDADLILVEEATDSDSKKRSLWSANIVNNSIVPVLNVHSIKGHTRSKSRA